MPTTPSSSSIVKAVSQDKVFADLPASDRHKIEQMVGNYKLTPATLMKKIDPNWISKPFLEQASLKIAQTILKPNGRLIISWPPRHGKSQLATIATPVWTLESMPQKDIILATYGADLSVNFGRSVRDIFDSNKHLLNERIRPDVKSVAHFMTTRGGGMLSVGLGGAITGKGADVFIIDDYIKTMSEALTKSHRESNWEWFKGTAYHRLEPNASMIIIATRWHEDDLIGRILKQYPGEWEHIKFQATALEGDILGRKVGEALFPERYDESQLADRRKVLGDLFYNAIFQQDPRDDASKLSDREWIEEIDQSDLPQLDTLKFCRIWDFGGGTRSKNDPTVGTLMACDPLKKTAYILDIWRKRASPETVEAAVRAKALDDGTGTKVVLEKEPGASGVQLMSHFKINVLRGFRMQESNTTMSKAVRAQPFLAASEAGRVKILKGKPWTEDFLEEFDSFPDGQHDDQVDTCAIGYNVMCSANPQSPTWAIPNPSADQIMNDIDGSQMVRGATW